MTKLTTAEQVIAVVHEVLEGFTSNGITILPAWRSQIQDTVLEMHHLGYGFTKPALQYRILHAHLELEYFRLIHTFKE